MAGKDKDDPLPSFKVLRRVEGCKQNSTKCSDGDKATGARLRGNRVVQPEMNRPGAQQGTSERNESENGGVASAGEKISPTDYGLRPASSSASSLDEMGKPRMTREEPAAMAMKAAMEAKKEAPAISAEFRGNDEASKPLEDSGRPRHDNVTYEINDGTDESNKPYRIPRMESRNDASPSAGSVVTPPTSPLRIPFQPHPRKTPTLRSAQASVLATAAPSSGTVPSTHAKPPPTDTNQTPRGATLDGPAAPNDGDAPVVPAFIREMTHEERVEYYGQKASESNRKVMEEVRCNAGKNAEKKRRKALRKAWKDDDITNFNCEKGRAWNERGGPPRSEVNGERRGRVDRGRGRHGDNYEADGMQRWTNDRNYGNRPIPPRRESQPHRRDYGPPPPRRDYGAPPLRRDYPPPPSRRDHPPPPSRRENPPRRDHLPHPPPPYHHSSSFPDPDRRFNGTPSRTYRDLSPRQESRRENRSAYEGQHNPSREVFRTHPVTAQRFPAPSPVGRRDRMSLSPPPRGRDRTPEHPRGHRERRPEPPRNQDRFRSPRHARDRQGNHCRRDEHQTPESPCGGHSRERSWSPHFHHHHQGHHSHRSRSPTCHGCQHDRFPREVHDHHCHHRSPSPSCRCHRTSSPCCRRHKAVSSGRCSGCAPRSTSCCGKRTRNHTTHHCDEADIDDGYRHYRIGKQDSGKKRRVENTSPSDSDNEEALSAPPDNSAPQAKNGSNPNVRTSTLITSRAMHRRYMRNKAVRPIGGLHKLNGKNKLDPKRDDRRFQDKYGEQNRPLPEADFRRGRKFLGDLMRQRGLELDRIANNALTESCLMPAWYEGPEPFQDIINIFADLGNDGFLTFLYKLAETEFKLEHVWQRNMHLLAIKFRELGMHNFNSVVLKVNELLMKGELARSLQLSRVAQLQLKAVTTILETPQMSEYFGPVPLETAAAMAGSKKTRNRETGVIEPPRKDGRFGS